MIYLSGAALAVFLIYLLRPPAQKVLVPSSLLWEQLVEQSASRRRLLRWLLSLLLSALIVCLLVSMIFRLEPRAGSVLDPILLVDNTGSMASLTQPGQSGTRLDLAKQRANEILDRSTGTITVADLAGGIGPVQVTNTQEARRLIASINLAPTVRARVPDQLFAASIDGIGTRSVFLISDQQAVLSDLQALVDTSQRIESSSAAGEDATQQLATIDVVDVWQPAPNVGITQFSPSGHVPNTLNAAPESAYLEVLNGGVEPITAQLRIDAFPTHQILEIEQAGASIFDASYEPLFERDLEIQPGAEWSAAVDLSVAHQRFGVEPVMVRAAVSLTLDGNLAPDAQPLDDTAWIALDAERTRLVAPAGARSLPRWLTRIIATSEKLELVRSQPLRSSSSRGPIGVTLYPAGTNFPQGASTGTENTKASVAVPCMVLPPTLSADSNAGATEAALIDTQGVKLSLPNGLPTTLPWTQLVAAQLLPSANANSWMTAVDAGPTPDSASAADTNSGESSLLSKALLLGPSSDSAGSGCLQWLFDPQASQLETRAEFPAVIERLVSALSATHQARYNAEAWGTAKRELVDGTWRQLGPNDPFTTTATLTIADGKLTVPEVKWSALSAIATGSFEPGATDSVPTPSSVNSIAQAKPGLRWPGRAALAALAIILLVAEAMTRLTGVTE